MQLKIPGVMATVLFGLVAAGVPRAAGAQARARREVSAPKTAAPDECIGPAVRRTMRRACTRDEDCRIAYEPCNYSTKPFKNRWKPSCNQDAYKLQLRTWRNKKPNCRQHPEIALGQVKPGRWKGDATICIKSQCRTIIRSCYRGPGAKVGKGAPGSAPGNLRRQRC